MRGREGDTIGGFDSMIEKEYYVRGCAFLLDAIGEDFHKRQKKGRR